MNSGGTSAGKASITVSASEVDGTPPNRGSAKRTAMIEAAAELFHQRGYHHTSMGDLAGYLETSKGNLYHHFRSKEHILYLIHDAYIEILLDRQGAASTERGTAAEQLEDFLITLLGVMNDFHAFVTVFSDNYRELTGEYLQDIATKRDKYFSYLVQIVERGIASGDFRPVDSTAFSVALLGMCNGTYARMASQLGQRSFGTSPEPGEVLADQAPLLADYVLRGIRAK